MTQLIRVDASGRQSGSVTRNLADKLITALAPDAVIHRDVGRTGPEFVNEQWIEANTTEPSERTAEHKAALKASDALVAELLHSDILLIATPIYNFNVPAALKAWIDMIARARVTFRYTPNGPVGLLKGKKAYVVIASGGTTLGSEIDFVTPYLRHVLGFIGIHDVEFVNKDNINDIVESLETPALKRAI